MSSHPFQHLLPPHDELLEGLECYVVGGAVRDALLGLPAGDRDWVVVGATPEQMAARGFIPVGGDFPVFLHPRTKEEFALARTERKSGKGYKGFTFYTGVDVSLAADLRRRDLTINALAIDLQGKLHDPLQGLVDIQNKVLRHVGVAFSEDPVRLLRLARFAARFSDFTIAADTWLEAQALVSNGEVDALVPERVWQEVHKALLTKHPIRMIDVLSQCAALERVLPGLQVNEAVRKSMDCAVKADLNAAQRFAVLYHQTYQAEELVTALKCPASFKDLLRLLRLFIQQGTKADEVKGVAELLQKMDVLRRPDRWNELMAILPCLSIPLSADKWMSYASAFTSVDAGAIAKAQTEQPQRIPDLILQARVAALSAIFSYKQTQ